MSDRQPAVVEATAAAIRRAAQAAQFSGLVSVATPGAGWTMAMGPADRGHGVPVTDETRFGAASVSKAFTALVVVSLIVDGVLGLDTPARTVLGADLPLIDDAVTVEHLLAHRSGIGDYLGEDATGDITDQVMLVPVHLLAETEQYLGVLGGHPQVSLPGERFAYNNGGYVVLALLAERAAGVPFHDLVQQRVFDPAGMAGAAYLRNDELPGDVAVGYLFADGLRTNALHLPVRGSGDGGAQIGVADLDAFWRSLFTGSVVPEAWVREMVRPRSTTESGRDHSGLGFWLPADRPGVVQLEGYDAGVSIRTEHDPGSSRTRTVVSNWSEGAWPVWTALDEVGV